MKLAPIALRLASITTALAACAHPAPAPEPTNVAPAVETIEVLDAESFRHDGASVTLADLERSLQREEREERLDREPLCVAAPAQILFDQLEPVLFAATSRGCDRVNITLAIADDPAERRCALPILVEHGCAAVMFYDGEFEYDDHGESWSYAYVRVTVGHAGAMTVDSTGYWRRDTSDSFVDVATAPEAVSELAPESGSQANPDEVRRWFDALEARGVRAFVCLDLQPGATVGNVVDALRAAKSAVGHRVLMAPDPWGGPELEEPEVELVE